MVSPQINMAKPNKQTIADCTWILLYLAWRNQVDSNMMHGIDHEDNTSALSTEVFLYANTANTLPNSREKLVYSLSFFIWQIIAAIFLSYLEHQQRQMQKLFRKFVLVTIRARKRAYK